jgi:hypothetical protein
MSKRNAARCKPVSSEILSWNAGAILDATREQLAANMETAVIYLEGEAKQLVSVPGDGHGGDPSAPGEPPHRQSGNLRADIGHEVRVEDDKVIGAIGVIAGSPAAAYARRDELGFVGLDSLGRNYHEEARPYLRPTILRNREKIVEILNGKS